MLDDLSFIAPQTPGLVAPFPLGTVTAPFALSLATTPQETTESFVGRLGNLIRGKGAVPLLMMIFGDCSERAALTRQLRLQLGPVEWPLLWSQGSACNGSALAGVQLYAVQGTPPDLQRILIRDRVVASCYSDGESRHCLLGGLGNAADPSLAPELQAEDCFEELCAALAQVGMSLSNVARTWFYNHRILDWYGDFNRVRTAFYTSQKPSWSSLPASTAVSGANPDRTALVLGAWAVDAPKRKKVVTALKSPLQGPAPAYGSSFSRAVQISSGGERQVIVSGTASITPDGLTAHLGDVERQIALTLDVVQGILGEAGMGWADVTRALAYCKDPLAAQSFANILRARGMENFPHICVHCDICRDNLLFELELDAAKKSR